MGQVCQMASDILQLFSSLPKTLFRTNSTANNCLLNPIAITSFLVSTCKTFVLTWEELFARPADSCKIQVFNIRDWHAPLRLTEKWLACFTVWILFSFCTQNVQSDLSTEFDIAMRISRFIDRISSFRLLCLLSFYVRYTRTHTDRRSPLWTQTDHVL